MSFLFALALMQVTVTISHQPLESFRAAIGERLNNIAVYSVLACNQGQSQETIPGGSIQQAAETQAHLNVVAPILTVPTGQRSKGKTTRSKILKGTKVLLLLGSVFVAAKLPHIGTGVTQAVMSTSAGVQLIDTVVTAQDNQAERVLNQTLAQVLDPTSSIALQAKACSLRLIFATYLPQFKPMAVTLGQ